MPRKLFKCTVELDVQAVTCPGVFLPNKDDIYLSVCMFGQYRKCRCVPAVFPLLVHERLRFQKVFPRATDPADVAQLLEEECVRIELIQLTLPGGESLAIHEGDVRCFLFPEPRLTPSAHGSDGQILLNRAHNYPGIAPQLEFSTRTSIVETSRRADGEGQEGEHWGPCSFCCYGNGADEAATTTRRSRGRSPVARTSPKRASEGGAARPAKRRSVSRAAAAVGSRARSTSPRQGYFPGTRSSPSASLNRCQGNRCGKVATVHNVTISYEDGDNYDDDDDGADDDDLTVGALAARPLSAPTATSRRTPLLDGRGSSPVNSWEKIHERVKNLLTTHRARDRLWKGATEWEVKEVLERRSLSPHRLTFRESH